MAKDADVNTDWERSAGIYNCTGGCGRKRLPASEFSKKQVEKALERLNTIADKDIRDGANMDRCIFLSAVCRKCTEEKEECEKAEAQARRDAREQAAEEAVLEPPERFTISLSERPFGMQPSKADESLGYVIAKVTEGKPASKAGVRLGWRVVEVAGKTTEGLDLEATQALLKAAELPASVEFEGVPGGADFCTACHLVLAAPLFSRKMRTKPAEKRRCSACVEASEAEAGGANAEGDTAGSSEKPQSKLDELQALCADSANQAEKVTGLKPVRGGGYIGRGGRARGRGAK